VAIGINCTAPQYIESLIEEIKTVTSKPIIVYPNGGAVYNALTKTWDGISKSSSYGKSAYMWYEKRARLIGGCCQTTPEDIAQIAKWVRA
jgi:homocysteine S-methyltransferase